MKKLNKFITFSFMVLVLSGCQKNEFDINKEVTLKGKIINSEITKDSETKKISILDLDEPIIIDGTKVNKIEIDYDKDLKNNTEVTIKGKINNNDDSNLDLQYSFKVSEVDDILSYINTFSNDDFSVTIPVDLIKICSIETIDNGFIIYSSSTKENEVFRIVSVSNEEFNSLKNNEKMYIEKLQSSKNKKVIIMYRNDNVFDNDDYENFDKIMKRIDDIKTTVKLKK